MSSPILNKISSVFVHVRNIERSANFYHRIFGFPERKTTYDVIHDIKMVENGAGMILDQITSDVNRSERPLFMFHTEDVRAAYRHIRNLGIEMVWGIEDHGKMAFFTFRDPDGNLLMVCGNPGERIPDDEPEAAQSSDSLAWAGNEWKHMLVRRAANVEQEEEGLLLRGRIESEHDFRTPLRLETTIRVDKATTVHLHFGPGLVILNGGLDHDELIVQHPAAGKRVIHQGKGRIPKKEWINLVWEIGELEIKLFVDGQQRHSQAGDFRYVQGKAGLETEGGEVLVRSVTLTQEKPIYEPAQLTFTKEGQAYGLFVPNPGCFGRITDNGLWLTNNDEPSAAWTTSDFKLPFECETIVQSDSGSLILRAGSARIKMMDGKVGFLDTKENEEWHDYEMPTNEFVKVKMVVEQKRMALYVNDTFIAGHDGIYPKHKAGIGVGSDIGSVVVVKSINIRELDV